MVKGGRASGGASKKTGKKMRTDLHSALNEQAGVNMDLRVQAEIGKHLRAIYDDVINEPVPSKFMELLEKLERSTTQKS
jgi:hypothetical protein